MRQKQTISRRSQKQTISRCSQEQEITRQLMRLEAEIKKKGETPSEVNKLKVAADALDGGDDAEDDAPVPEEDLEDDAAPDGDVDVPLADQ